MVVTCHKASALSLVSLIDRHVLTHLKTEEPSGVYFIQGSGSISFSPPLQLAEVKVRILEAKQTLEDCIAAQDFSRAAELKDSITELENSRNNIIQEIAAGNQPADKEVRTEKVKMRNTSFVCNYTFVEV